MSEYPFKIERYLTPEDVALLRREHFAKLQELSTRYVPEVDLAKGLPAKPDYLDVVRTSWLLDAAADKPPHVVLESGLGFALGLILSQLLKMRWCSLSDTHGQYLSMLGLEEAGGTISVPPFNYVKKKEAIQNAEVFVDLFKLLSSKMSRAQA